jgi:transcriptional antiterminator RfaH
MPILSAEPAFYPDDLWEAVDDPDAPDSPRWWCLHTKPRQEKATARHLLNRRLAYFLPQIPREGRTPAGRKIRSVVPLFPGYAFLRGDERQRIEAFSGATLVQVLEVVDQSKLVSDLRQIYRLLSSGLAVTAEPRPPIGSRVRIVSGPLTGLVGLVVRRGKEDQFTAVVRFLGQGVTVDLHDWQVEPAQ